jgi:hypothetical protein
VIVAAVAFVGIRIAADYISSSRHYTIDFEKRPESGTAKKFSNDELLGVIEKAYEASNGKRVTKGLPVLVDGLNFNQENNKVTLTTDEVDYGLNQLSEAGKITVYKNLIASAKGGEESIGAYYIYELAMKENSHVIEDDYKKMLKANNIIAFRSMEHWEQEAHTTKDSDISIVTLGLEQANSMRKKAYSYDVKGGYLLFLLSNGMLKCVNA